MPVAHVFRIAALTEQARGNLTTAVQLLEELEQLSRGAPACYRALPLPDVARICMAASTSDLIERFLEGADAAAARYRCCQVTARAVLAEARGDLEEAANRYSDASSRWKDFGVVIEHGHALFGLGRCATRLGDPAAGDRLLDARGIFAQLGARPLLAETAHWLQQATQST